MKIILDRALDTKEDRADYREGSCCLCGRDCNPHYRFFYSSKETDEFKNPLIDDELECCSTCYSKLRKMFNKGAD